MTEFEALVKNEYFVIDSENLENVQSRLYGYVLSDDGKVLQDGDSFDGHQHSGTGSYVWVKCDGNHISIEQDFNGCYGIYLFKNGETFVCSNSFWVLVDYVSKKYPLTVDWDYARAFIAVDLCSISYDRTLCNEIVTLPRDVEINIDKTKKSFELKQIDYAEQSIPLSSKLGMDFLDSWFYKWTEIIRTIKSKTNNIVTDLSGGFDSRMVLALFLNAGIDLNKIKINSINDEKHCHAADYRIASEIARHFGFTLNNNVLKHYPQKFKELDTVINNSFYVKLGFHKQMYFKYGKNTNTLFWFCGAGGECVRDYWNQTTAEYSDKCTGKASRYSNEIKESTEKITDSMLQKMKEKYNTPNESDAVIPFNLYKETRCRNHFGKEIVESYLANIFKLAPLLDPHLRKLQLKDSDCNDRNLLMAVILDRYCPDLLNFDFEGGRFIESSTINHAKNINGRFPFNKVQKEIVSEPKEQILSKIPETPEKFVKVGEPDAFLLDVFKTKSFRGAFTQVFSPEVYDKILNAIPLSNYFPNRDVYACIAVVKMMQAAQKSQKQSNSFVSWLDCFKDLPDYQDSSADNPVRGKFSASLSKFCTARIDFKNIGGQGNSLEVASISDKGANCTYPAWLKNEQGSGLKLQSCTGNIDIELKCIGSGELKIWLRGIDLRDKNGTRIPIWIDYTAFRIDGEAILKKSELFCHDKPFVFVKKIADGQVVKIHAEWKPFDSQSVWKNQPEPKSNQSISILSRIKRMLHRR